MKETLLSEWEKRPSAKWDVDMSDQKANLVFSLTNAMKNFQKSFMSDDMQKSLKASREAQERMFASIARAGEGAQERIQKSLMSVSEEAQKGFKAIKEMQEQMAASMAKAGQGMRKFKAGLPHQLQILAEHGWFILGDYTPLAAIYPLAHLFQSGQDKEAHRQMCGHIRQQLTNIEESLVADYPKRAVIVKRAFDAVRANDYVVSIPLMLMQADGIGREIIAANMPGFSVTSKRPDFKQAIKSFISATEGDFLYATEIFNVVLENIPINVSERDPLLKPGILNRNSILHGLDTDYYTELNALRAVSWIGYVHYFKDFADWRKIRKK
jgi:hypothetical protein